MKIATFSALLVATLLGGLSTQVQAQERVWRCGNEYTNNAGEAQRRNCKLMEGGNVTVVQGTSVSTPSRSSSSGSSASSSSGSSASAARAPAGSPRIESTEQRQRDSDARAVLESELQKAQSRHSQLLKDYNNGEPEKQGSEAKNYQKYLDRVADMKSQITRTESDIAGLQREIARLPAATR